MSEISTQSNSNAHVVVTDTKRKDAQAQAGNSASARQGGGKQLPPLSDSINTAKATTSAPDQGQNVKQAVAKLNDYVQSFQRDLKFTVDEELGRPIVRVVDRATQEVVRQIPNDVTLRLARNLNAVEDQRIAEALGDGAGSGVQSVRLDLINTRI